MGQKNRLILIIILITSLSIIKANNPTKLDSLLIQEDNFYAYLYKPKQQKDLKPIIVLGGSDGGIRMKEVTRNFALAGFAALNVAYFNYKDLPKGLIEIPVEYFEKPIQWLLKQEYVSDSKIAIYGFSRGAEMALLLASEYPEVSVTIVVSGSHLCWGGFGGYYSDEPDTTTRCAWTKSGKPLPYMNIPFDSLRYVNSRNNADYVRQDLKYTDVVKKAQIPIEKSKSDFLLISGKEDTIWPSTTMFEDAIKILNEEKYQHTYEHIILNNEGHAFDLKKTNYNEKTCWDYILNFIIRNLNE